MKIPAWLCWGLAALAAVAARGEADARREDARVKRALEEEGLRYRIDENWNFLLTFEGVEEDRTHVVFVNSATSWLEDAEIREIYGMGYWGRPLPKARLAELLEANAGYKLGAWEVSAVETDEDNDRSQQARFCIRLDADATPETLRAVAECVADICDRIELEWTGDDKW